MNIIQRQASDFYSRCKLNSRGIRKDHKEFIQKVRIELFEYKKTTHKIEFIQQILIEVKQEDVAHTSTCKKKEGECQTSIFYKDFLFFLQEEIESLEENLSSSDFTFTERQNINTALQQILEGVNFLKTGQEVTYDDFKQDFEQLKELYFLDKKTWSQLFAGKLTEMVAGGVVSETASKGIIDLIKSHYSQLFSS